MKPFVKKPLTARNKWLLGVTALMAAAVAIGFVYWTSIKEPSWKYVQSFENGRYLTSVDKTFKRAKTTQEDFFLIHIYDFNTNVYQEAVKVPIQKDMAHQAEYKGYSERYIWLTTPEFTAVDMLSPNHEILDFEALKKRICSKNSSDFKDVIELAIVEEYLKATNQNGDQFFVNVETFATTKTAPKPYYEVYHKAWSITPQLPVFLTGSDYSENYYCEATVGNMDYVLKPADENNPIKRSFFSSPHNGPDKISITATDSTQIAVQNGTVITTVNQAPAVKVEKRLTEKTFINAVGLGVSNNRFVFRYQKSVDRQSPWFLTWFDLKTASVIKEIDLSTEGIVIEKPQEELSHHVSPDGKWAFFTIDQKKPVRIRL
ncbi:MAG TPA: hypothetical protein VK151_03120 [Fluviicola sp.]|nr:hypothetical protein [Fluviicola sp.]